MEWYKSHTSLRKNAIYRRLSPLARQAFRNAMDAVADYEQGDKLALRIGKLTNKELAEDLLIPIKMLQKVLRELESCGFFTLDSDGVWHIEKFTEKTESHAERQRRYRKNRKDRDGNGDASRVTHTRDDERDTTKRDGYRSREKKEDQLPNGNGVVTPKQTALPTSTPSDLSAWLILDAAWPIVSEQHDLAIKRDAWRKHNKSAAKDLADNGKTPAQVTEMLTLAYTHPDGRRFYGGITTLAKLIEHWPKLAALESEPDDGDEISRAIRNGGIRVY